MLMLDFSGVKAQTDLSYYQKLTEHISDPFRTRMHSRYFRGGTSVHAQSVWGKARDRASAPWPCQLSRARDRYDYKFCRRNFRSGSADCNGPRRAAFNQSHIGGVSVGSRL